jgi:undecaprenyl-diphosphatase
MIIADVICGAIGITVIVGRTLSGAHWLTDIIAGILISAVLVCLYRFEILTAQNRRNKIAKKENAVND